MQTLIFAAGEGRRMRPLTNKLPKPLIKFKDSPILDHILQKLAKINPDKIVINGFYLADKIDQYIKSKNNPKIIFSRETVKLETGGGLINALKYFDTTKPILIINGDIYWQEDQSDLQFLINNYQNQDILLGLKEVSKFHGYQGQGDFSLDPKTTKISTTNPNLAFIGIQIFNPKFLNSITLPKSPFSINHFYFNAKKLQINLSGIKMPSNYFHLSRPADII